MKYQTMKSPHDEEDGLLHQTNSRIKNGWNIWSIVNVLLWTVTICLLIYSFTNRIPGAHNIRNKINNIEQAVGSVDVKASILNALKKDVKNIEDKALHIERKDIHHIEEFKDNWKEYYFVDEFGLRVLYNAVLGKFHNSDILKENLSIEIDDIVVSDVHVEALNMDTEQAMIKTPIGDSSLFLLDCEACYESLKNSEAIENCKCRVLTANLKDSEQAVGDDDEEEVTINGKTYKIKKTKKMEFDLCTTDKCRKEVVEDGECLAGVNAVYTPDGKKLIQKLKIDEYIKTGQREDGSAIYNRIVYLVAKGTARHLKLEVEDGSFVTLTPNHNVITQNGEMQSSKATLDDFLLHEDGTFKKIVSIESDVIDNTYALRTNAFSGLICTNGLYASENTVEDVTYFRKVYNFIVFKIALRLPYFANFVHHHPYIGIYTDVMILLMVVSMISYGLRQKERSLKME